MDGGNYWEIMDCNFVVCILWKKWEIEIICFFFLYLKRDNFGIIMSEGIKLIEFYYVLVSLVYGMDGDCIWYYIWVWGCVIGL